MERRFLIHKLGRGFKVVETLGRINLLNSSEPDRNAEGA
jgi:hypothetical protein